MSNRIKIKKRKVWFMAEDPITKKMIRVFKFIRKNKIRKEAI